MGVMVVLTVAQDNSGTIEREEFLSLPQISSNPLATRCVTRTPEDDRWMMGDKQR